MKRKNVIDVEDTPLRIMMALIYANKPLTMAQLAREAKLDRQLVKYHIPRLIGSGLLLPVEEDGKLYYSSQPCFMDDKIFNELANLLEPVIKKISENIICVRAEDGGTILKNNLLLFIRTWESLL
ncbi:MAG: helix-turn-helix domain-containing protein [Methanocellales archaeon]|nr:helix-turn-helix domain-containing protein [Methanocellales archaeon]